MGQAHLKIGITGGIGAGKTTVCKIFEQLGVPVYYADVRAKELMHEQDDLKKKIRQAFGWDAYDKKEELNRPYLAKIVFNDPRQLSILNQIVHPAVFDDYNRWVTEQSKSGIPYSVKEAALLIESGSYKQLDKIIVITCPIDLRIERIMKRDHLRREEVLKRMENQLSDRERLDHADCVIRNGSNNSLILQVMELHRSFLKEAEQVSQSIDS
ncbi:MAG: dephospho-CoA kinase [Flavobacteriales bacterium]|nr:dephospho-CoA kinase [Flavobacteriales bacterium]